MTEFDFQITAEMVTFQHTKKPQARPAPVLLIPEKHQCVVDDVRDVERRLLDADRKGTTTGAARPQKVRNGLRESGKERQEEAMKNEPMDGQISTAAAVQRWPRQNMQFFTRSSVESRVAPNRRQTHVGRRSGGGPGSVQ